MKKTISLFILLFLLFLVFEFWIIFFKKEHVVSYKVFFEDKTFNIEEVYKKDMGDVYDIKIKNDDLTFNYVIKNKYNKQKKVIKNIEYFHEDNSVCIYPILEDDSGTYLQCVKNGKFYMFTSFDDQGFISKIRNSLKTKGYTLSKKNDIEIEKVYSGSTIYSNNLIDSDMITLWVYKGIHTITSERIQAVTLSAFDKYENTHGYLVDHYYIAPNYLSSKVLEFSSVTIIDLNNHESRDVKLKYTLSSDTYINGVVDGKLYYTDPSNLLQLEINPSNNNVRLIGSKELGGQVYDGSWKNANIYDFVSKKILFKEKNFNIPGYSYDEMFIGKSSYYFYNDNGEVYQVIKNNSNNPIMLFKASGINNFKVIDDTIYYVVDDTLYYYKNEDGIIPLLKNNELRYNTFNRIDIYRKS